MMNEVKASTGLNANDEDYYKKYYKINKEKYNKKLNKK